MPDALIRRSFSTATTSWQNEQDRIVAFTSVTGLALLRQSVPSAAHRLQHLAGLKDGWNGDGSVRMSQTTLDACAELLCSLASCSRHIARIAFISPLSSGGVELEWDSLHSKDFLLSIPANGSPIEYLISHPATGDSIEEGVICVQEAVRLFKSEVCSQLSTTDFQPHLQIQTDFIVPSTQNMTKEMAPYRQPHSATIQTA